MRKHKFLLSLSISSLSIGGAQITVPSKDNLPFDDHSKNTEEVFFNRLIICLPNYAVCKNFCHCFVITATEKVLQNKLYEILIFFHHSQCWYFWILKDTIMLSTFCQSEYPETLLHSHTGDMHFQAYPDLNMTQLMSRTRTVPVALDKHDWFSICLFCPLENLGTPPATPTKSALSTSSTLLSEFRLYQACTPKVTSAGKRKSIRNAVFDLWIGHSMAYENLLCLPSSLLASLQSALPGDVLGCSSRVKVMVDW